MGEQFKPDPPFFEQPLGPTPLRTRPETATMAELQRTASLFRQLLDSAPDAMVVSDHHGTIILVNTVTEILFGYPRADLVGRSTEILLPTRHHAAHRRLRRRFLRRPQLRPMGDGYEMEGRRKDGEEFPAKVSLGPLASEDGMLIVSAIRDISRRKKVEQSVRKNLKIQKIIGEILHLSLATLSLDEFLQQTLDLLLDVPWLRVE